MRRRDFFRNTATVATVGALVSPFETYAAIQRREFLRGGKLAKNIIFMVSDGMSNGTLTMADELHYRKEGTRSRWLSLYQENEIMRGLMDTSSASSLVTDSAAASSAWGGGVRVPNGRLNTGAHGEEYKPILQKFKAAGKAVGCVTTVPINHATPAGFCVNIKNRGEMETIAEMYLSLQFDVMMGGGAEYFSKSHRKDGKDMLQAFREEGYQVAETRSQMMNATGKPLLGVFSEGGLPYSLDLRHDETLRQNIPTLPEMTRKAIDTLDKSGAGFVLQVEGGKVDWAAHANDIGGLLYDQLAFDEAVGVAIDFAKHDKDTMVIITTDHGNGNPGLLYGSKANEQFDQIQHFKHTNTWVLNNITKNDSAADVIDRVQHAQGIELKEDEAKSLLASYQTLDEESLYNPRKLPFHLMAEMQRNYLSVGWAGSNHTSDFVEVCVYGKGKELLNPTIKNTDMHQLMLQATGLAKV